MADKITLSRTSRYKDTPAYNAGGVVEFGLWEAPPEFVASGLPTGVRLHTVLAHEVGFLDLIAIKYYGDGSEVLWWTIAQANGIIDPETEMVPGQKLKIPPESRRASFIGRGGRSSASV